LKLLDAVVDQRPESRHLAPALFYRGKCHEALGAAERALENYERFVAVARGSSLAEEAAISIIDLADTLYRRGKAACLQKMLAQLGNENKVVSYYAAFKLSHLPDRKIAARALPVLQAILDHEDDDELRDRARIAVMRIDPARLKEMDRRGRRNYERMIKIRISDKGNPHADVSLSIPLALADLALKSLSQEQKRALQKEGYDLDKVLTQLTDKNMKIDIRDNESTIQIWVE
jgi:tetratricopeptide (TPR) repeat protein